MEWILFFSILIAIESPTGVIGDTHLTNKAYGRLQIRKPYLEDVNRIFKTSYTMKDMEDPKKSMEVSKLYLTHYGTREGAVKNGMIVNYIALSRIHNGGPNGTRKVSTKKQGIKFSRELQKRRFLSNPDNL